MVCGGKSVEPYLAGLLATEGAPALSGIDVGRLAEDGKLELGVNVGMADGGALFGKRFVIVSDASDTGCSEGTLKGKELVVTLAELELLGTNVEL